MCISQLCQIQLKMITAQFCDCGLDSWSNPGFNLIFMSNTQCKVLNAKLIHASETIAFIVLGFLVKCAARFLLSIIAAYPAGLGDVAWYKFKLSFELESSVTHKTCNGWAQNDLDWDKAVRDVVNLTKTVPAKKLQQSQIVQGTQMVPVVLYRRLSRWRGSSSGSSSWRGLR